MTTTTRPACPYPCAGSCCPHTRQDAECIACEARPALDAYHRALQAWADALPDDDGRASTAEIQALHQPHRATRALGIDGQRY
jgi:hypothetical protein